MWNSIYQESYLQKESIPTRIDFNKLQFERLHNKSMSLTRPNPFNRPSPFKNSSYDNSYLTSYSPTPGIIQSQVKPISPGFTTFTNNRSNNYSHSPIGLGGRHTNYQEISNEANKQQYLNTMIPTNDNLGPKDINLHSYGSSYTKNLNMNSNYSLLEANNPLSKENPFNRPSLLSNNIGATRTIGLDDYCSYSRPSTSYNPVGISDKYSYPISNSYDHLSYKSRVGENFSTDRMGGIERIESKSRFDNLGTDYLKYESKSPNKYVNTNLNLNTNYNLNSDKSDTGSVRSYINKIGDFDEGKEDYQSYYSIQQTSSFNNPFNRKSLNPTIRTNQNKPDTEDYHLHKGPKDYSHLEYKGSYKEDRQRKKYGYVDEQQLKYPYELDKYKYKYQQQKKMEEKQNTIKEGESFRTGNQKDYQKYGYEYGKDILSSKNQNREEENRQQYKGLIQKSIYNTVRSINPPDRVPESTKHRKPYEFEDYHQNQMDYEERNSNQSQSNHRSPSQNPKSKGRKMNNTHNNRDIKYVESQKKYNFDKKQSYEEELQRVNLKEIVKNNKQYNTNYADNFNNHKNHQFQDQRRLVQDREYRPLQHNQYQSPQFGMMNTRSQINQHPKRDLKVYMNTNVIDDNRMLRNARDNIIRFDQEHDDQQSYGEQSNKKYERRQPLIYEQKNKQAGQYSSSFVFRDQEFCRLEMV